MKHYILAIALITSFCSAGLLADDKNAESTENPGKQEEKRWGIGAFPIIGYDDESSLTLGASAVLYFEPEDSSRDTDEIVLSISYNLADQYDIMVEYSKYFKNNFCSIDGSFGYQNYPDDYMDEDYDAEYFPFEIGAAFRLHKKFYIGPLYSFKFSDTGFTNGNFESSNISGTGRMHMSGAGGQMIYKNIPNGQLYRREGNIFKLTVVHYSPVLMSSSEYTETVADYRHYLPVLSKCVLAFQVVGKSITGDVPFYDIPELEGKSILRGGSDMKGKYFLAGQTEFRFPVFWRIGAAVFAGTGEVAEKIKDYGGDMSVAGGAGLRIALNREKNINMRFDAAFNEKGESSLYLKIKEAF